MPEMNNEDFARLKEILSTFKRYENPAGDGGSDSEHVDVSWWDGSVMFPIQGYYLSDLTHPVDESRNNTFWQENVVWCGDDCVTGDRAKEIRYLGTLDAVSHP